MWIRVNRHKDKETDKNNGECVINTNELEMIFKSESGVRNDIFGITFIFKYMYMTGKESAGLQIYPREEGFFTEFFDNKEERDKRYKELMIIIEVK